MAEHHAMHCLDSNGTRLVWLFLKSMVGRQQVPPENGRIMREPSQVNCFV